MSIESVMPSNHLILCCPLFLLPTIFPSIRVFSNESVLCIRWKAILSLSQAHILAVISENPSSKPAYSTLGNTTVGPFKIYLVSDSVFPPAMPPSSALTHPATGACWLVSHSGHPTWLPSLNTAARVIFPKHASLPVCPSEYRPEVHILIPPHAYLVCFFWLLGSYSFFPSFLLSVLSFWAYTCSSLSLMEISLSILSNCDLFLIILYLHSLPYFSSRAITS